MFNRPQQDDQSQAQVGAQAPEPEVIAPPDPALATTLDASAGQPPLDAPALPGNLSVPAPSTDDSAAPAPATTAPATTPAPSSAGEPVASDELLGLKQEALQQLSPLVGHLDQTPEERFRTTMMMIQATDDSTKIKDAYDAAKQITDDKARAQALLDIVNEINYFTQQHHQDAPQI